MKEIELNKKDIVYYARAMINVGIFEVIELKVRTVADDYFTGIDDKTKHAFIFNMSDLNRTVFFDRREALKVVKEAEKNKRNISEETYYEEY